MAFWQRVFCEPNGGEPSFARVGTGVLVAFACGWTTAIVRWTHALPELGELGLFMTILYGLNKTVAAFQK